MEFGLLLLVGLGVHYGAITEYLVGSRQELRLPSGYLGGVQLESLAQLAQCLALLERLKHHARLEGGGVFAVVLLDGHGLTKLRSSPVPIYPATSSRCHRFFIVQHQGMWLVLGSCFPWREKCNKQ